MQKKCVFAVLFCCLLYCPYNLHCGDCFFKSQKYSSSTLFFTDLNVVIYFNHMHERKYQHPGMNHMNNKHALVVC